MNFSILQVPQRVRLPEEPRPTQPYLAVSLRGSVKLSHTKGPPSPIVLASTKRLSQTHDVSLLIL